MLNIDVINYTNDTTLYYSIPFVKVNLKIDRIQRVQVFKSKRFQKQAGGNNIRLQDSRWLSKLMYIEKGMEEDVELVNFR